MEIQGLPLLNINTNRPPAQARSSRKPASSNTAGEKSSQTEATGQSLQTETLISVSNTVADSNGINLSNNRLTFSQDEDTGRTVISIVDNKTGDVIRQIPPDEILTLKKKMGEIQGLLLDRKV